MGLLDAIVIEDGAYWKKVEISKQKALVRQQKDKLAKEVRRSLSKVGLHKVRHAQGDHKRVAAALVQTWDGGGARKGLAGGRHDLTSAELLLYMKNWYMRCAGFLDQVCFFLMPALFTVYLACEFVNVGSEYPSRLNHFGFKPSSVSMPHVNLYESGTVAPSAAP